MSVIDTIFSSVFYMTVITIVWMFTFIGLSFLQPFKNKKLNILYKGTMFVMSCLIMVVPMFVHYGLATDFKTMTMGRTTFCLFEQYEQGGGESSSETVCRLSIMDKKTGQRKDRRYIGYTGELLGQKGDTVAYLYNEDLVVMNARSLEEIYVIDKDEWGKTFPVLSDGVDQMHANQNFSEPRKPYLEITGKNANHYWFEPFSRKLLTTEPQDQKITGIYSTGYDLYLLPAPDVYQRAILIGINASNGTREKIAPGDHYEYLFGRPNEESFIDPKFLCIDTVKKCFVFAHYRTIDKKEVWIEAKDFTFKTLWKKNSSELDATDSYNEEGIQVYCYEEGLLYFNIGGYFLCMEPMSGKIKWNTRL